MLAQLVQWLDLVSPRDGWFESRLGYVVCFSFFLKPQHPILKWLESAAIGQNHSKSPCYTTYLKVTFDWHSSESTVLTCILNSHNRGMGQALTSQGWNLSIMRRYHFSCGCMWMSGSGVFVTTWTWRRLTSGSGLSTCSCHAHWWGCRGCKTIISTLSRAVKK